MTKWTLQLILALFLGLAMVATTGCPADDDDDSAVGDDDDATGDDDDATGDDDDATGDDDDATADDDDATGDDDDATSDDDDATGDDDDSTTAPAPPLEFTSVTSGAVVTSPNYSLELYVAPAEPVGAASSSNYQLELGPGAIRAAQ